MSETSKGSAETPKGSAETPKGSAGMSWLAGLVIATMLATCAFMVVRITLFLLTEGQWYDRLAAAALLFAECFYFINCLGYFGNVYRVLTRPRGDVDHVLFQQTRGDPVGNFCLS
jgi:hypothetical protein